MEWQLINSTLNDVDRTTTVTDAMQLPHGCLVRTRQLVPVGFFEHRSAGIALAFVPGAKLREDGSFEHRM